MNYTYIYIESLSLSIILLVALLILHIKSGVPAHFKYLGVIYGLTIFSAILDIGWILIDGKSEFLGIAYPLHIIYLSSFSIIAYCWFLYCGKFFLTEWTKKRIVEILFFVPVITVFLLILTSPFTGLVFYIDEKAVYHRGVLYSILLCVGYFFLLFTAVVSYYCSRKTTLRSERSLFISLTLFSVPPVLLGLFSVIAPPGGLPTLQFSIAFALLLIFINLQNSKIMQDSLTCLSNRFSLHHNLTNMISNFKKDSKPLHILMCDIDNFKYINDTYGHLYGDEILKSVAKAIDQVAKKHSALPYRMGGDEFLIITTKGAEIVLEIEEDLHAKCSLIKTTDGQPISMCVGTAEYVADNSLAQFLDEADKSLYNQKNLAQKK